MKFRIKVLDYSLDEERCCLHCLEKQFGLNSKIHEIDMDYLDFFDPDVPIKNIGEKFEWYESDHCKKIQKSMVNQDDCECCSYLC
jgi:hypothetical protein